ELMRPVLHKSPAAFEGRMTVRELDGSAEGFCRTWRIASFPQLLFFWSLPHRTEHRFPLSTVEWQPYGDW
ncbi:MAG: hypothetical protein AB7U95_27445, partial [Reyranella sp.]